MNVPDLRHVDFDSYRQRARDLQAEAIDAAIDRLVSWVADQLNRRRVAALAPSAHAAT